MKAPGRVGMPKSVEPMLATLSEKPFNNDAWIFELKLDGVQAIVEKNGAKLDMWTACQTRLDRCRIAQEVT